MEWEVKRRAGKVFIDHNMNREGANIASAFSCRPEPGATVSTPITWEEVEAREVRPGWFNIKTIWARLEEAGDPFRPVIEEPQDLDAALEALAIERDVVAPLPANIRGARGRRSTAVARGGERVEAKVPKARPGAKRAAGGSAAEANRTPTSEEVIARSKDPKLGEYLRKRDLSATPEPGPSGDGGAGDSFVIQKHRATRLHYDTRLERNGVLVSWAVPRGLPVRKGDKRLAVQTEDHPLEYGTFEGVIPKGHYGAGPVQIFDSGTYEVLEWTDRKVSFRLHGRRYRDAEFHLIKTATDWLVFLSSPDRIPAGDPPPAYAPMLAEGGHDPFDDPRWRFEPKLDGVRTLAYVGMDATRLVSRTGRDQTEQYPEIGAVHEYVTAMSGVLDGEIVAMDDGRPSFELLQQRINLASKADIERVRRRVPVELYVFDLLYLDGEDLTSRPIEDRRELLESLIVPGHRVAPTLHVDGDGVALARAARERGFEGVVAKRLGSLYRPGRRSPDWRKIKLLNRQECVILGWTPGTGARSKSFGALLVGAYDEGRLRWIGQVGTGFTEQMLRDLMERLEPLRCGEPAADDPELRKVKGACFVEPKLVCEVEYLQMTSAGKLRAPSYKGLRTDKLPEDCILERPRRA
jgi:bifunctional non-homologous end joining protein LigD